MFVPERVRRDLIMSAAIYGGMFLGDITHTLVQAWRARKAPAPAAAPAPEVSDDTAVPQ